MRIGMVLGLMMLSVLFLGVGWFVHRAGLEFGNRYVENTGLAMGSMGGLVGLSMCVYAALAMMFNWIHP